MCLIQMDPKAQVRTNDSYVWLEWVLFPFTFIRPNIYSILGSKYVEGYMPISHLLVIYNGLINKFSHKTHSWKINKKFIAQCAICGTSSCGSFSHVSKGWIIFSPRFLTWTISRSSLKKILKGPFFMPFPIYGLNKM